MKHLLCCLAITASALADTPQMAALRVDAALARDYLLAREQQRKSNFPLPPTPVLAVADDAVFLRRACIDIAGRLPQADEVRAFLADQTPDKRARLTDALVQEPGAVQVRFRILSEAFRVKEDDALAALLLQAAKDDRPFDQIITSLIGEGHLSRRDNENWLHTATEVASAVLGEDMNCAMCHDHPYNSYTQKQCYQFAACFAPSGFPAMQLPRSFHQGHGRPGDLVKPTLLPLTKLPPPTINHSTDSRVQVAKWITTEGSHRFASVAALRVWSGLFGMPRAYIDNTVGGIDPAPSWDEAYGQMDTWGCFSAPHPNPIFWIGQDFAQGSPQNVFNALGAEFRSSGCRMGEFQRILARTTAYNRAAFDYRKGYWMLGLLVPAPQIRRLPAEVIWDVLSAEKSDRMPPVPPWEHPLRMLGRGTREWSDESTTPISHELVRFMMNSPDMDNTLDAEPVGSSTEDLFLAILGRYPSSLEQAAAQQQRNEAPQTATQDIAWALLNTAEFMFRP